VLVCGTRLCPDRQMDCRPKGKYRPYVRLVLLLTQGCWREGGRRREKVRVLRLAVSLAPSLGSPPPCCRSN
jgi:hypothetical protein